MKTCILFLTLLFFVSCGYRITKNNDGEPIVEEKLYTFKKKLTQEDLKVVDTTAVYVQIFDLQDSNEQERSNPMTYSFHNDGYFRISSVKFYGKFDDHRPKNSTYYGGKFSVEGDELFIEAFYPTSDGNTNFYNRVISKGTVKNDTIRITIYNKNKVYVKKRFQDVIK